jgi:Helix-turn-helix domain
MSGIVRDPEKVPVGTARLECVHCKKQHSIADIDWLGDPLRCSLCDEVGVVPRRHDRVADKYPGKLGERFMTLPHPLFEPDNGLELTSAELFVIVALERFRWRQGDLVYPSQERIASMLRIGRRTVQRALDALIGDGLIIVRKEARTGQFTGNVYDLAPLWQRLEAGGPRSFVQFMCATTTHARAS